MLVLSTLAGAGRPPCSRQPRSRFDLRGDFGRPVQFSCAWKRSHMPNHQLPGDDVVVDGVRLHVVRYGPSTPGRPPLLLLHGLGTSSYLWRDVMRAVGHDTSTIAPDLIGLGRSEFDANRVDLPNQALAVLRLLDEWDIGRVVVAGHDLGGSVALHLATLAPDRVAGLALVDAPVHADAWPVPAVLPLLAPGLGRAYVSSLRRVPARRARPPSGAGWPTSRRGRCRLPRAAAHPRGSRRSPRRHPQGRPHRSRSRLGPVRVAPPPALVLWGTHDAAVAGVRPSRRR